MTTVGFDEQKLLAPEQAIVAYFSRVTLATPRTEHVALDDAFDRVLADDMLADDDYPSTPRSAMDGVAVASVSVPGRLRLAGEILMGSAWGRPLERGTALRIPTGGVVPDGADAVVPVEDLTFDDGSVAIDVTVEPGANVTPAAKDMHRGELVLPAGRRIGGPELGVLATLGVVEVPVFRRPVIAVISSGDELVPPSTKPRPGQIRDSNRYAIAGALRAMGAVPRHYPTVVDTPGALEAALARALAECDGAMLTGGSSVGERDLTPSAVATLGEPGVVVHGLRVKPGKPTVLAAAGGKPVIGLPGNPTSALVILEAVAAPIVAALTGSRPIDRSTEAKLVAPLRGRPGWTWYVPVALQHEDGAVLAHPLPLRSSMVSLTARADGYVIVGEQDVERAVGERVRVYRFL